jgi:hypothetical protein
VKFWKSIFTRTKKTSNHLLLEGTPFPILTAEALFFKQCRSSGQAAFLLPFVDFWSVDQRGYENKAFIGGGRLFCSNCHAEMPMSFKMSLPGGVTDMIDGNVSAFGEGLPHNVFEAAEKTKCPYCESAEGIVVVDHPDYHDITEQDITMLHELWQFRCRLWWENNDCSERVCDRCNREIFRGQGYHLPSELLCETCALDSTGFQALSELRRNPDYFGMSELRRARNLSAGRWRFEPPRIESLRSLDRETPIDDVAATRENRGVGDYEKVKRVLSRSESVLSRESRTKSQSQKGSPYSSVSVCTAFWKEEFGEGRRSPMRLDGADLCGAVFAGPQEGEILYHANFEGAKLDSSIWLFSFVRYANFTRASLRGAFMFSVPLNGAIFREADLSGADIFPVMPEDSESADFTGANLTGARITFFGPTPVILTGANLSECHITRLRLLPAFPDLNVSAEKGLKKLVSQLADEQKRQVIIEEPAESGSLFEPVERRLWDALARRSGIG